MSDRNAMQRTVAVRVAALVVVVGLLVGIGQGAFVDQTTVPFVSPDAFPMVASTESAAVRVAPAGFDHDAAELARPVDTF